MSYLAALIRTHFNVSLEAKTLAAIRSHLWQVGPSNYEDLVSAILLECWQTKSTGAELTDEDVRRAADRVRQRLVRELKRTIVTNTTEQTASVDLPPDEEAGLVIREFRAFLQGKSPQDALLFQRYFLDGNRNIAALAQEFGISQATIYRKLDSIRSDYLALRDLRQPPHAAD